jgi:hypothetical protein
LLTLVIVVSKETIHLDGFFFFQKKKQKAFVLLSQKTVVAIISAKPTLGVWGLVPKNLIFRPYSLKFLLSIAVFFFQKKKQKAFVPLRGRSGSPNLGEADPGGLGACPQVSIN